jgi:plastocyanin
VRASLPGKAGIRLLLALGALTLSALGAGCGRDDDAQGTTAASASSGDAQVDGLDFEFDSAELTVEAGATVTWINGGETIHTVKGRAFFSRAIDPGGSYRYRFTEPGEYRYFCTLHPTTMRGTISVREEAT